jgi:hypothetical protein
MEQRAQKKMLEMVSEGRLLLDHHVDIGMVERLDGEMSVADLVEAFGNLAYRRNADDHVYQMDKHVRRFIVNCLREHLPRRMRALGWRSWPRCLQCR